MALPEYAALEEPGLWRILVRVQPGAKKNQVDGIHAGRLKLRLTAPAVENKANKALVAFAAKLFQVKKSRVTLASGERSREKALLITAESLPTWPGV